MTEGVEADGELAITRSLAVAGAYTYLDARDDATDLALTGRHTHQGHLRLAWRGDHGTQATFRGMFYGDWIAARTTAGDTVAPGFAVWDAFVSQRVVQGISLFAAVDNLLDNQDPNTGVLTATGTPAAIYRPEAGRTFRGGLRWSWTR